VLQKVSQTREEEMAVNALDPIVIMTILVTAVNFYPGAIPDAASVREGRVIEI